MTDRERPTSKQELLDQMAEARAELDDAIARIPRERFLESRQWGEWTLKDCVAHIAAYERWTAEQSGPDPSPEEIARMTADAEGGTDALNESIYRRHRDDPLETVLTESRAAYEALRRAIEELDEDGLARPRWWTGEQPLLEAIAGQSHAHYRDHLAELESAAVAP